MPRAHALRALAGDLVEPRLRRACARMAEEVEDGASFASAYRTSGAGFPASYTALVEAGTASGDLAGVLDEIATHASQADRLRDRVRHDLRHPLIGAGVVALLAVALLVLLPPTALTGPYSYDVNGQAESIDDPAWPWLVAGAVVAATAVVLAVAMWGGAWLRRPLDGCSSPRGLGYRLPLFGRLRCYGAKARFAGTMALLLRHDVPLDRALVLCAATPDSGELRSRVEAMAVRAAEGAGLTETLRDGGLIPPSLLWLVEAAGSSRSAARALEDTATVYRQRLERSCDRVALFAVPVVQLMVGFAVFAFAICYLFPVMRAFDAWGLV